METVRDALRRGYRPIADYGVIGDGHSAALIASDGSIDWLCFPRFDGPAVFGRLLDSERGGFFQVRHRTPTKLTRAYLPGTNVLQTVFQTSHGRLILTDAMPLVNIAGPLRGPHRLIRGLEAEAGQVVADLIFSPRFDYGRGFPLFRQLSERSVLAWHGDESLLLEAEAPLAVDERSGEAMASIRLPPGERCRVLLRYSRGTVAPLSLFPRAIDRAIAETVAAWQAWAGVLHYRGPYAGMVERSALTLKLLTYAPNGAIVAAPTTSLPEEIGSVRNWDYRYTWLRDAALTVYALCLVGHPEDAIAFQDWICAVARACQTDLQVVYRVDGERKLSEVHLPHLHGYRGSRPVRVGNAATTQRQLDVYGEALDCVDLCRRFGYDAEQAMWSEFHALVNWVCDHWREADYGLWEVRTTPATSYIRRSWRGSRSTEGSRPQ